MIKRIIILLMLLCLAVSANAADHFVCSTASGNDDGTDWANALTDLPSPLTRGDTYYVADGSYGTQYFDDAASGTDVITVKKATATDHGTETGWNSNYGDGQAVFTWVRFDTDYHVFDGNDTDGYGFSIEPTSVPQGIYIYGADNITIKSVTIDGTDGDDTTRGIKISTSSPTTISIENVEIQNTSNDCIYSEGSSVTFNNLYLHSRRSADGVHADAFEISGGDNNTIKNSRIDWQGQQIFFGGTAQGTWYIYGNRQYGGDTSGKAIHTNDTATWSGGNVYYYNNSVYDIYTAVSLGIDTGDVPCTVKNNVFYNIGAGDFSWESSTHDYNFFETGNSQSEANEQVGSDPFNDAANDNFYLSAATDASDSTIGATYGTDPDGETRGADGVWDRGAYEYVTGASGNQTMNLSGGSRTISRTGSNTLTIGN